MDRYVRIDAILLMWNDRLEEYGMFELGTVAKCRRAYKAGVSAGQRSCDFRMFVGGSVYPEELCNSFEGE